MVINFGYTNGSFVSYSYNFLENKFEFTIKQFALFTFVHRSCSSQD